MKQKPATLSYVIRTLVVLGILGAGLIVPACGTRGGGSFGPSGGGTTQPGMSATNPIGPDQLSAVVAAFVDPAVSSLDLPAYVQLLMTTNLDGVSGATAGRFPVPNFASDDVRTIPGVKSNVVVRWLDPLTLVIPGRVNLINDAVGTAATASVSENVANSNFKVTTMAGGSATAAATGRLQVVPGYQLVDGDFFTLNDGTNTAVKFEFDKDGTVSAGATAVPFKSTWNVHRIVWAVVDAINKVGAPLAMTAYDEPVFGSHPDFIGYFGDGYNNPVSNAPQWNGSGQSAWLWVNHEYITTNEFPNFDPFPGLAPQGQEYVLTKYMRERGLIDFDPAIDANWDQAAVDMYIRMHKKQVGGSFMHVIRDPGTGEWTVDKGANNQRFDGTSATRSRLTGQTLSAAAHDDFGTAFPAGIISGTFANCSGVVTPWGTVFSGEENTQDYYGDLESWWDGNNQFIAGRGLDAGNPVNPTFTSSLTSNWGLTSDPNGRQNKDGYGYPFEIDPTRPPNEPYTAGGGNGFGHRKMGSWGRARWENVCVAVDLNWNLVSGQPLVMYGGDDRIGGGVYKWVSATTVTAAMAGNTDRPGLRALMDTGKLYVAHFQGVDNKTGWSQAGTNTAFTVAGVKGNGKWIELSTTNVTDDAPNSPILAAGGPAKKVGAALLDNSWNNMGGFPDDIAVKRNMFTSAHKIGIFEMNRPEEFVYNPVPPAGLGVNPLMIFSLTKWSGTPPALGPDGVLGEVVVAPRPATASTTVTVTENVGDAGFKIVTVSPTRAVILPVPGIKIVAGVDTLTVNDGVAAATVFTFRKTSSALATDIVISDTDTVQGVAAAIIGKINAVGAGLLSDASGAINTAVGQRTDKVGRIWALDDGTTPGTSTTFQFFEIFTGVQGTGLFDAANPDNIAITKDGSIWFGTDGNFGLNNNKTADAVYYLDTTHNHLTVPTAQGRAFRILSCPADAEHTGPCFSADRKTLFNSIQHPGEFVESTWPNGKP